jgi:DUF2075 family protein
MIIATNRKKKYNRDKRYMRHYDRVLRKPHRWFAWYPVWTDDGEHIVWLSYVTRTVTNYRHATDPFYDVITVRKYWL